MYTYIKICVYIYIYTRPALKGRKLAPWPIFNAMYGVRRFRLGSATILECLALYFELVILEMLINDTISMTSNLFTTPWYIEPILSCLWSERLLLGGDGVQNSLPTLISEVLLRWPRAKTGI